jgi:type II secretory pathway pseudopilin PulG
MALLVVATVVTIGLSLWVRHQASQQAAAVDACRSEAMSALEMSAGDSGFMNTLGNVTRHADAYVVEVNTWVLDNGRQVEGSHRVVVCTATEEDGQWFGELEP